MTPTEDEQLFTRVRRKFRRWSVKKASGYVHGVRQGEAALTPFRIDAAYANAVMDQGTDADDYAIGYVYGFIDAYGSDVTATMWFKRVSRALRVQPKIEYHWWAENDSND